MPEHLNHRSSRRRRQKERPWENTWGDNSWKLPLNREGNNHPSPRNPDSPKQDKSKAKHPKTHINQIYKDQTQRTNIKSSKGKTTNNSQTDPHKGNSWSFNRNSSDRREWQDILKVMKEENITTQITVPSKDLIQIWRRNQKLYRQAKAQRIQHHQTSSSTNAKGSSLDRKHRKRV